MMDKVPMSVTPARFAEVWRSSRTIREVADRLEVSRRYVRARVARYRRSGMVLEELPAGRS